MTMSRSESATVLTSTIRDILGAYPDLLEVAISAITGGIGDAFQKQREQLASTQLAMSLSLALLPPNRINDVTRKHLETVVLKAIPTNRTLAEQRFVDAVEGKDYGM
jgi:hypothetical protein